MNATSHWKIAGIAATFVIICSVPFYLWRIDRQSPQVLISPIAATFSGSAKCAECHNSEYDRWKGSHHDLAMDKATEETVLGDFNNAVITHQGVQSRFFRRGEGFFVHTRGRDGRMEDYEVQYVFGVYPLQQYLVPFPGGRLQCLPLAWDSRQSKWYHLYPDNPQDPRDWLYWTNAGQNWNGMCAECHSTDLKKNYDPQSDSYQTTWSEIDVSCEACHGPGSRHVAWAQLPAMARPQTHENYELSVRTRGISARDQVELCAPCHSRRSILSDYTHFEKDLLDSLLPTLLDENIYFADGQILEEDYVYGSFTQSKMYHREVRCGDCHDVHSIKTVQQGNALCLQCHKAAVYDTAEHHFHKKAGESGEPIRAEDGRVLFEVGSGSECVQCHMPGRTYMGIDYRPDHSLRIPRPDLSIALGTPNACNRCHGDKGVAWADAAITKWYGPGRSRHYGTILAAGRQRKPEAGPDLIDLAGDTLYPVIVRATSLSLLGQYPGENTRRAIEQAATDPEALIRYTAVRQAALLGLEQRKKLLSAMLYDPVKAVRMEAANEMAAMVGLAPQPDLKRVFRSNLDAYIDAMNYSADFAFGRFNLGNLYSRLNKTDQAIDQYKAAIKIDNQFYPAMVNLGMLFNREGDNAAAEKLFRDALAVDNALYQVHYSMGLLLAEEQRYVEAAGHLEFAAKGMPDYARVHYNLGQLWDYLDNPRAQTALEHAYRLDPKQTDYLKALIQYYLKHRQHTELKILSDQLLAEDPQNAFGLELKKYIDGRR